MYEGGKNKNREINSGAEELLKKYALEPKGADSVSDIQMRLASRFINEALYCLQDGILRDPVSPVSFLVCCSKKFKKDLISLSCWRLIIALGYKKSIPFGQALSWLAVL